MSVCPSGTSLTRSKIKTLPDNYKSMPIHLKQTRRQWRLLWYPHKERAASSEQICWLVPGNAELGNYENTVKSSKLQESFITTSIFEITFRKPSAKRINSEVRTSVLGRPLFVPHWSAVTMLKQKHFTNSISVQRSYSVLSETKIFISNSFPEHSLKWKQTYMQGSLIY